MTVQLFMPPRGQEHFREEGRRERIRQQTSPQIGMLYDFR